MQLMELSERVLRQRVLRSSWESIGYESMADLRLETKDSILSTKALCPGS